MTNITDFKIIDGDYTKSSDFENLIFESEGCTKMENEFVVLESKGNNIVVTYDIQIEGSYSIDRGDYLTPDFVSIDVDSVDIEIQAIEIDENEIELTKEVETFYKTIIKKLI